MEGLALTVSFCLGALGLSLDSCLLLARAVTRAWKELYVSVGAGGQSPFGAPFQHVPCSIWVSKLEHHYCQRSGPAFLMHITLSGLQELGSMVGGACL